MSLHVLFLIGSVVVCFLPVVAAGDVANIWCDSVHNCATTTATAFPLTQASRSDAPLTLGACLSGASFAKTGLSRVASWTPNVAAGSISAPRVLPARVPAFAHHLGASAPTVALIGVGASGLNDVKSKLTGTSLLGTLTTIDLDAVTPTLAELQSYDVLFVFPGYSNANSPTFSTNLKAYVDAGGALVTAMNVPFAAGYIGVNWPYAYRTIDGGFNPSPVTLGTIAVPSHPIMAGVSTFDGGSYSRRASPSTLVNGGDVIAYYSDGSILVATRGGVGPGSACFVELNMSPPSADVYGATEWNPASDGARLMANALLWANARVCPKSSESPTPTVSVSNSPAPSGLHVCLIGSAASGVNDVKTKLTGTGLLGQMDVYSLDTQTPTLAQLTACDICFVFPGNSGVDAPTFSTNLKAYVDSGRHLVTAMNVPFAAGYIGVNWPYAYRVIDGGFNPSPVTLGTIAVPSHPIMAGVSTFDGGSYSRRASPSTLVNGGDVVAYYSDGTILVATRGGVGPGGSCFVELNMSPPSADVYGATEWNPASDGARLMANAILYAHTGACPVSASPSTTPSRTRTPTPSRTPSVTTSPSIGASQSASGTSSPTISHTASDSVSLSPSSTTSKSHTASVSESVSLSPSSTTSKSQTASASESLSLSPSSTTSTSISTTPEAASWIVTTVALKVQSSATVAALLGMFTSAVAPTGTMAILNTTTGSTRAVFARGGLRADCLSNPLTQTVYLQFSNAADISKLAGLVSTGDQTVSTSSGLCIASVSSLVASAVQPSASPAASAMVSSTPSALAIGLGVGLGLGLPVLLVIIACLWYCCCRKTAAKKIVHPEASEQWSETAASSNYTSYTAATATMSDTNGSYSQSDTSATSSSSDIVFVLPKYKN